MKTIIIALIVFVLSGCAVRNNEQIYSAVDWNKDHKSLAITPKYKTIAIMPFINYSNYQNASIWARKSFYGNLSSAKDYELQPLKKTNLLLKDLSRKAVSPNNYKQLGEKLDVDIIAFGEVIEQTHSFGLIYAKNKVKVHVYLIDTKDGKVIWESTDSRGDTLVGVSFCSMINMEFMWAREVCNRYDELFRDMIVVLPNCKIK